MMVDTYGFLWVCISGDWAGAQCQDTLYGKYYTLCNPYYQISDYRWL